MCWEFLSSLKAAVKLGISLIQKHITHLQMWSRFWECAHIGATIISFTTDQHLACRVCCFTSFCVTVDGATPFLIFCSLANSGEPRSHLLQLSCLESYYLYCAALEIPHSAVSQLLNILRIYIAQTFKQLRDSTELQPLPWLTRKFSQNFVIVILLSVIKAEICLILFPAATSLPLQSLSLKLLSLTLGLPIILLIHYLAVVTLGAAVP